MVNLILTKKIFRGSISFGLFTLDLVLCQQAYQHSLQYAFAHSLKAALAEQMLRGCSNYTSEKKQML